MTKHLKLPENNIGRDLIVGDVHGCYDQLWTLLDHLSYNYNTDRLFFVGDLIDRGPNSLQCLDMILLDSVYSTLGNHEDMMFQAVLDGNMNAYDTWLYNGGSWSNSLMDYHAAFHAKLFPLREKFPLIISVGEGDKRFNIVHGELFSSRKPLSDESIDQWDFTPEDETNMIWGRTVIRYAQDDNDVLFHYNMSPTYCGHTPVRAVITCQSQIFIDTGCCFAVGKYGQNTDLGLTIVSHQQKRYWTIHPSDNGRITTYDLPEIFI